MNLLDFMFSWLLLSLLLNINFFSLLHAKMDHDLFNFPIFRAHFIWERFETLFCFFVISLVFVSFIGLILTYW